MEHFYWLLWSPLCVGSVLVKSLLKCFCQWSNFGKEFSPTSYHHCLSNVKNLKEKHMETNKLILGSCLQAFHRAVAIDSDLLILSLLCIAKIWNVRQKQAKKELGGAGSHTGRSWTDSCSCWTGPTAIWMIINSFCVLERLCIHLSNMEPTKITKILNSGVAMNPMTAGATSKK